MEAVQVNNLIKRYGDVTAVDDISFSVEQGKVFGFLGPNGAGKSTTQRIITGVIKPDHGEVSILGYNLQQQPLHAKQMIGVVPELANVYVDMTAWDNLMFVGELYGTGKNERYRRAAELLELFGLYEKRHLKTRGFSKGMKQRVLLSMALMNDPQVLFLDEPTGGLDVQSTRIIRDIIREFNRRGKTIFLTTHNIEEANQLCDSVAIINQGKIAAIDRPENLRKTLKGFQPVEVAFNPDLVSTQMLEDIESIKDYKKAGDKYILYTDKPGQVVTSIVDLARSENVEIISLHTMQPTLEDVFLHLISKTNEFQKEGDKICRQKRV